MSHIYIQEPPTDGKVLLKTTVGEIDVELWSKEAPKACRNFVQLCLEGFYNGTIFHRVVKGFIVQGGDPTGTGTGGESIYGQPFKDEFHSRLRFKRRGLVAMANAGKDDNGSQFFFTFAATPELQNKHTVFGKVTGETVFNMMKLEDALVDHDDRPEYPQKILATEVLHNPFSDIVPRLSQEKKIKKEKEKEQKAGVKNFKLLSFGEEAEEDEEEVSSANVKLSHRGKSTHDVLNDPNLSSVPAVDAPSDDEILSGDKKFSEEKASNDEEKMRKVEQVKRQLKKLDENEKKEKENSSESEEEESFLVKERREERKRKADSIRKEIIDFKRSYQEHRKQSAAKSINEEEDISNQVSKEDKNELILAHKEEERKYKLKNNFPKQGSSRESFTLGLLDKFRKKLHAVKERSEPESEAQDKAVDKTVEDGDDDASDDWMAHQLRFEDPTPVLAKDANTKDSDWYEIHDPRSRLSKQRRELSKNIMKNKERR